MALALLALLAFVTAPPGGGAAAATTGRAAAQSATVFLTTAGWPSKPQAVFLLGLPRLYCWVRNTALPPGTAKITFSWAKDGSPRLIDRFALSRSNWGYTGAYDTDAARSPGRFRCAVAVGGKTVGTARYRVVAATAATGTPAPDTSAAPPPSLPPTPTSAPQAPVSVAGAFAVGDSVMLDAAAGLQSHGISVDAAVSRQFTTGIDILRQMAASGRLPSEVVVGLGTNGPFSAAQFDEMMGILRGVRRVVFVTVKEPRFWEGDVNGTLRAGVARWPNARLADWHAISWDQPSWFAGDGIHLSPAGAAAYTQLVVGALA